MWFGMNNVKLDACLSRWRSGRIEIISFSIRMDPSFPLLMQRWCRTSRVLWWKPRAEHFTLNESIWFDSLIFPVEIIWQLIKKLRKLWKIASRWNLNMWYDFTLPYTWNGLKIIAKNLHYRSAAFKIGKSSSFLDGSGKNYFIETIR